MNYYVQDSVNIVEVSTKDLKIVMCDKSKKTAAKRNFANCGFFAPIKENGSKFTLPVANLVCDYEADSIYVKKYCSQRGEFFGDGKYSFDGSQFTGHDQFHGKTISTFMVRDGIASIEDCSELPGGLEYAISGIPVMRSGRDVKFDPYVLGQGWEASSLYNTWHTFIGLKGNGNIVYVMAMKTKTKNMIVSAEAFKKFKALGMVDVIKLDGGGSFIMNVGGKNVASTLENRRINTIITFDTKTENPYEIPTVALQKGNRYKEFNRWLQWQLNGLGYFCDIDGSFGNATLRQVLAFQKDHNLVEDGSVGPATRAVLLAQ